MWPQPITLCGTHAKLTPLSYAHLPALQKAATTGDLHKLWYTTVPAPLDMERDIARRLELQAQGNMLPFTVMTPDGTPVGMTTFMNIDAVNKRLEIGSTWYASTVQRTGLNTEAKCMLLTYAFEVNDCIAVEFRTHFMNQQSRRAIERLGAKLDGVLRNHMVMSDGTLRDTAVYSILAHEWPAVRSNLQWRLEKTH